MAGVGDVNEDGFPDLLIGASHVDNGGESAGAAYLVLGEASLAGISLASADARFDGDAAGDVAGMSVGAAGDTNADGRSDMLVGAFHNSAAGNQAGAVYLILGIGE